MVLGGVGSTILTFAGVARELAAGELTVRPIDHPPLMSIIAIAIPRAMRPSWLVAELTGLVRDVIAALVQSGEWPGARLATPVPSR